MTQGTIGPILLTFTFLIPLGNLFQLLYNTADSIVAGNFVGLSSFAAVSATTHGCGTLVRFLTAHRLLWIVFPVIER